MTKFTVHASERVYYTFVIEADSLEAAVKKFESTDYNQGDIVDGDGMEIDEIFEAGNAADWEELVGVPD